MNLFLISTLIAFVHVNAQHEGVSECYRAFARLHQHPSFPNTDNSIANARLSCQPKNGGTTGLRYECEGNRTASGLMPTNQHCTAVWHRSDVEQVKYECWDFAVDTDFGPFAQKFYEDSHYHCPDTQLLLSYSRHVGSGGTTYVCEQEAVSGAGIPVPYYSEGIFFEPFARGFFSEYTMDTIYGDCGSAVLEEETQMPSTVGHSTQVPAVSEPMKQGPTQAPNMFSRCEQGFYTKVLPHTYETTNRTIECFSSEEIEAQKKLLLYGGIGRGGIAYECPSNTSLSMVFPYNHHCVMVIEGTYEEDGIMYQFQQRDECSDYATETNFTIFHYQANALDTSECFEEMWYRHDISVTAEEDSGQVGDQTTSVGNNGLVGYKIFSGFSIDEDTALHWVSFEHSASSLNETGPAPDLSLEPDMDSATNDGAIARQRNTSACYRTGLLIAKYAILAATVHLFVIT